MKERSFLKRLPSYKGLRSRSNSLGSGDDYEEEESLEQQREEFTGTNTKETGIFMEAEDNDDDLTLTSLPESPDGILALGQVLQSIREGRSLGECLNAIMGNGIKRSPHKLRITAKGEYSQVQLVESKDDEDKAMAQKQEVKDIIEDEEFKTVMGMWSEGKSVPEILGVLSNGTFQCGANLDDVSVASNPQEIIALGALIEVVRDGLCGPPAPSNKKDNFQKTRTGDVLTDPLEDLRMLCARGYNTDGGALDHQWRDTLFNWDDDTATANDSFAGDDDDFSDSYSDMDSETWTNFLHDQLSKDNMDYATQRGIRRILSRRREKARKAKEKRKRKKEKKKAKKTRTVDITPDDKPDELGQLKDINKDDASTASSPKKRASKLFAKLRGKSSSKVATSNSNENTTTGEFIATAGDASVGASSKVTNATGTSSKSSKTQKTGFLKRMKSKSNAYASIDDSAATTPKLEAKTGSGGDSAAEAATKTTPTASSSPSLSPSNLTGINTTKKASRPSSSTRRGSGPVDLDDETSDDDESGFGSSEGGNSILKDIVSSDNTVNIIKDLERTRSDTGQQQMTIVKEIRPAKDDRPAGILRSKRNSTPPSKEDDKSPKEPMTPAEPTPAAEFTPSAAAAAAAAGIPLPEGSSPADSPKTGSSSKKSKKQEMNGQEIQLAATPKANKAKATPELDEVVKTPSVEKDVISAPSGKGMAPMKKEITKIIRTPKSDSRAMATDAGKTPKTTNTSTGPALNRVPTSMGHEVAVGGKVALTKSTNTMVEPLSEIKEKEADEGTTKAAPGGIQTVLSSVGEEVELDKTEFREEEDEAAKPEAAKPESTAASVKLETAKSEKPAISTTGSGKLAKSPATKSKTAVSPKKSPLTKSNSMGSPKTKSSKKSKLLKMPFFKNRRKNAKNAKKYSSMEDAPESPEPKAATVAVEKSPDAKVDSNGQDVKGEPSPKTESLEESKGNANETKDSTSKSSTPTADGTPEDAKSDTPTEETPASKEEADEPGKAVPSYVPTTSDTKTDEPENPLSGNEGDKTLPKIEDGAPAAGTEDKPADGPTTGTAVEESSSKTEPAPAPKGASEKTEPQKASTKATAPDGIENVLSSIGQEVEFGENDKPQDASTAGGDSSVATSKSSKTLKTSSLSRDLLARSVQDLPDGKTEKRGSILKDLMSTDIINKAVAAVTSKTKPAGSDKDTSGTASEGSAEEVVDREIKSMPSSIGHEVEIEFDEDTEGGNQEPGNTEKNALDNVDSTEKGLGEEPTVGEPETEGGSVTKEAGTAKNESPKPTTSTGALKKDADKSATGNNPEKTSASEDNVTREIQSMPSSVGEEVDIEASKKKGGIGRALFRAVAGKKKENGAAPEKEPASQPDTSVVEKEASTEDSKKETALEKDAVSTGSPQNNETSAPAADPNENKALFESIDLTKEPSSLGQEVVIVSMGGDSNAPDDASVTSQSTAGESAIRRMTSWTSTGTRPTSPLPKVDEDREGLMDYAAGAKEDLQLPEIAGATPELNKAKSTDDDSVSTMSVSTSRSRRSISSLFGSKKKNKKAGVPALVSTEAEKPKDTTAAPGVAKAADVVQPAEDKTPPAAAPVVEKAPDVVTPAEEKTPPSSEEGVAKESGDAKDASAPKPSGTADKPESKTAEAEPTEAEDKTEPKPATPTEVPGDVEKEAEKKPITATEGDDASKTLVAVDTPETASEPKTESSAAPGTDTPSETKKSVESDKPDAPQESSPPVSQKLDSTAASSSPKDETDSKKRRKGGRLGRMFRAVKGKKKNKTDAKEAVEPSDDTPAADTANAKKEDTSDTEKEGTNEVPASSVAVSENAGDKPEAAKSTPEPATVSIPTTVSPTAGVFPKLKDLEMTPMTDEKKATDIPTPKEEISADKPADATALEKPKDAPADSKKADEEASPKEEAAAEKHAESSTPMEEKADEKPAKPTTSAASDSKAGMVGQEVKLVLPPKANKPTVASDSKPAAESKSVAPTPKEVATSKPSSSPKEVLKPAAAPTTVVATKEVATYKNGAPATSSETPNASKSTHTPPKEVPAAPVTSTPSASTKPIASSKSIFPPIPTPKQDKGAEKSVFAPIMRVFSDDTNVTELLSGTAGIFDVLDKSDVKDTTTPKKAASTTKKATAASKAPAKAPLAKVPEKSAVVPKSEEKVAEKSVFSPIMRVFSDDTNVTELLSGTAGIFDVLDKSEVKTTTPKKPEEKPADSTTKKEPEKKEPEKKAPNTPKKAPTAEAPTVSKETEEKEVDTSIECPSTPSTAPSTPDREKVSQNTETGIDVYCESGADEFEMCLDISWKPKPPPSQPEAKKEVGDDASVSSSRSKSSQASNKSRRSVTSLFKKKKNKNAADDGSEKSNGSAAKSKKQAKKKEEAKTLSKGGLTFEAAGSASKEGKPPLPPSSNKENNASKSVTKRSSTKSALGLRQEEEEKKDDLERPARFQMPNKNNNDTEQDYEPTVSLVTVSNIEASGEDGFEYSEKSLHRIEC